MLTQFVFMVFAILGVMSLIVDVGLLRVTQGQMQPAADAAAIEGLRKRDVTIPVGAAQVNDPFAADCIRRASANRVVRWTFDDDVDPTNGDLAQYGAGPVINVSDGVGNLHGLATLSVPDPPVYKPDLQMNQGNEVQGDMVSGRFCYTEDPSPSESANYEESIVCTQPQNATGAYARNDFNPAATAPTGPAALPF